jgi:hypothetical protein
MGRLLVFPIPAHIDKKVQNIYKVIASSFNDIIRDFQ